MFMTIKTSKANCTGSMSNSLLRQIIDISVTDHSLLNTSIFGDPSIPYYYHDGYRESLGHAKLDVGDCKKGSQP